jgi:hypothetical protein
MLANIYSKLAIFGLLVALFAAENLYVFNRGKQSVFSNIISGQAVFQEKEQARATEDVKHATADTQTIAKLTEERNALKRKLANVSPLPPAPDCQLDNDQWMLLQALGSGAKQP